MLARRGPITLPALDTKSSSSLHSLAPARLPPTDKDDNWRASPPLQCPWLRLPHLSRCSKGGYHEPQPRFARDSSTLDSVVFTENKRVDEPQNAELCVREVPWYHRPWCPCFEHREAWGSPDRGGV